MTNKQQRIEGQEQASAWRTDDGGGNTPSPKRGSNRYVFWSGSKVMFEWFDGRIPLVCVFAYVENGAFIMHRDLCRVQGLEERLRFKYLKTGRNLLRSCLVISF